MADTSLSRRAMLTGALSGAALIASPVDLKIAQAPKVTKLLGLPTLPLPLPTLSLAAAEDVPSYILPPIIVTPPYGSVEGDLSGGGFDLGYNIYANGFGNSVYQQVLRQRAIEEQQRQRQAIADQWNALYNAWLNQFGPDAARIATQLQWAGMEAANVIGVIATLEAAAAAIEAGAYIATNRNITAFLAESMRNAGLVAGISVLSVGFITYFSAAVTIAVGLALIYIVVRRVASPEAGPNYVGLRPIGAPDDWSGDLLFFAE
jgi:hypothetical protein